VPEPTSFTLDGNVRVDWVTAIAIMTAPDLSSELASLVALTEYLTEDGFNPALSQDSVEDRRLSTTENFQRPGRKTRTLNLTYVWQQQGSPTDNLAYSTLVEGAVGFLVVRYQTAYTTAYAVAQKVDIWPVQCGGRTRAPFEANGVGKMLQQVYVRSSPAFDSAIVA
jgi:hypothetical protein